MSLRKRNAILRAAGEHEVLEVERVLYRGTTFAIALLALLQAPWFASPLLAGGPSLDRGPGVAASLFGLRVAEGELILHPSFEYAHNRAFQYSPTEFGYGPERDFDADFRAAEGVVSLAWGASRSLAVELEAGFVRGTFRKSVQDTSALPGRLRESGLGDVEARVAWRVREETAGGPEIVVFTGAVLPHDRGDELIGTADLVLLPGFGLVRGFRWGTLGLELGAEVDFASGSELDWGEWTAGYLRRLSPAWTLAAGFEGQVGGGSNFDEVWLVTQLDWDVGRDVALRFGNGLGISSHAAGWEPEVGLLLRLP